MSSTEDKPSADDPTSAVGSPYDEKTEAIERPKFRRPRPDNDDFFDRHGRRPAPAVQEVIDKKAERDSLADVESAGTEAVGTSPADAESGADEAPTVAMSPIPAAADTDAPAASADAKTAVIINSGGDAQAENPVKKSVSTEQVRTEPFAADDDTDEEPDSGRRYAEQMTEPPLPYIEPQPTTPLALDDEYDNPPPVAPVDLDDSADDQPAAVAATEARRGTIDLGLLLLRLVVGLTFTLHGLQKLTGWMNGPGPDGFADFLANSTNPSLGFNSDVTTILSFVTGVGETAGGILLMLGLLTPIAGATLLSAILVAMTYKVTLAGGLWFFAADGDGSGVELEVVLAAAVAALILTGPGTYSFDRRWGWSRRPAWGSAGWLIVGIGVAIAVWIIFNGANPLASWM
ncbi:DoxX family membrane protein [Gordonia sp. (in: high G+C Gram-positive bacteria)]|uniref:DoxX family membrane protein n=1 Tax=Gordonia sp. (in: high G+C Gram-positive bacteria) TaxID=84139 RepID=UPI00168F51A8|nr:DoxX family membrane protein [Gordonia sp. (in: high G+C Gram-positive bacteria)]NLG47002.1 DoxX family membrane protein [Gordonia sp. (in: high G+C Gram-positive bacteria)]